MVDVVKAILRSLGIHLVDVRNKKVKSDYDSEYLISTDHWFMVFEYGDSTMIIELNEVSSKESWADLSEYREGIRLDFSRVGLADKTVEDLHKIIKDFIER